MSEEQAIQERAAIANEVWNDSAEQSPPTITDPVETAPLEVAAEPDPWSGIPAALREEVEGLRAKIGAMEAMDYRLKQTESRLGGVLNDLHAAKEAAKSVSNAPTQEQIAQASTNSDEWEALKEDFPDWTNAMDHKLAAERAEIMKQLPNVEAMRKELQDANAADRQALEVKFGTNLVLFKHPDFLKTKETPEFKEWHAANGSKDSFDPLDVIATMDEFSAFKAKQKSPSVIAAERAKRLEQAQQIPGHKLPPTKSEADMSDSEIRASVAKQVWG